MIWFRLAILFLALLIDKAVGDPPRLWARVPHPVVLFGKAVAAADRRLNVPGLPPAAARSRGILAAVLLTVLALACGVLISAVFSGLWAIGLFMEVCVVAILLAQKSLADHVGAVAFALNEEGLTGGRREVAMIVGRDPQTLDAAGVSRAAIESLAENYSDGVVAPAFWYMLLGLPGLFAYKMINTADSMIGHKSEKYLYFGWASARWDDLVNLLPARASAVFIALAAWTAEGFAAMKRSLRTAIVDHGKHRSPNSGWPEAAMAGAINVQLAGPRVYHGELVNEEMLNIGGRRHASSSDIRRAIRVFDHACYWLAGFVCALLALQIA
ncbi:adenosylcobinamide-phosphate synthase CbiB [Rhizobium sp. C4]|uniref:adenosylcobinamide-phosphate synthase CbiB n=1 Tax=Rhizobium sp. C4 TaxID=1349800 RepID=UPI001E647DDB|nr:adenosylcobinamide-phosphate synthase CbiB [Rhizobium sp. C4]MCD2173325.1 adenosylcobinamide-phosphate synthase CbiB [Rhizobium sp. C4]